MADPVVIEVGIPQAVSVELGNVGPALSDSLPEELGTASAGIASQASRADHVHAHGNQGGGSQHTAATTSAAGFMTAVDKTKLDAIEAGANATVLSGAPPANIGSTDPGASSQASRADHVHAHGNQGGGTLHANAVASGAAGFMTGADKAKLDGIPSSAVPTSRTVTAGAGLTGGGDLSGDRTLAVGANGDGSIVVNADDIQVGTLATDGQHGNRGGGSMHATAVASGAAGFMSGTDKAKLDAIGAGANVVGAASSTDNAVARMDGTTGKVIQNSAVTIDDSGNIATAGTVDGRDVSADGALLDARLPTSGEKAALAGTSGSPGAGNPYVSSNELAPYRREKVLDSWVNVPLSLFPTGTGVLVTYAFNMYIAVGNNSLIAVSTDHGVTWSARSNPQASFTPSDFVFGNGTLIVYNTAGNTIVTTDGLNWRQILTPVASSLRTIAFGNGSFVAAQFNNGNTTNVFQSTDGITWNTRAHNMGSVLTLKVAYTSSGFVLTTTGQSASWSADGITWVPFTIGASAQNQTAFGAGLFVTVGNGGVIYTSSNGTIWQGQKSGTTNNLTGVTFVNSTFIAWGAAGTLLTSPDGITWTSRTTNFGANAINTLDYGASVYVIAGAAGRLASSSDLSTWTLRTSGFSANAINKVKFLNSLFVAVGAAGNISTSSDGLSWTARTSGVASALNDVAYGASTYVAVGAQTASIGVVLTSAAGTTWASQTSNYGNFALTGILFDSTNSLFVGYGGNTTSVITSSNATAWTAVAHNMAAAVNHVIFANGVFTAVGASGKIATSPTGVTFTARTSGVATTLSHIVYNGSSMFVIVGGLSLLTAPNTTSTYTSAVSQITVTSFVQNTHVLFTAGSFMFSGDTAGRLARSTGNGGPFTTVASNLGSVQVSESGAYSGSTYVVIGATGALSSSPDGFTWTARTSQFSTNNITQVVYALGVFVAVGAAGTIASSPDGFAWTLRTSNFAATDAINWIATDASTGFVALASHTNVGVASVSADGLTWSAPKKTGSGISSLNCMSFGAATYIIGGIVSGLYSSSDGTNWTERESGFSYSDIKCSTFAAGLFVIGGTDGKLATSPDGITWTLRNSQFGTDTVQGVLFAGGKFVAYGTNGKISTSADGLTWTAQTSGFSANAVNKIVHTGTTYVAVGAGPTIATSSDAVTWTPQTSNAFSDSALQDIAYASSSGVLVAVGTLGCIVSSSNGGTAWTQRDSLVASSLTKVVSDGTAFMVASATAPGLIHSASGTTWSRATSFAALIGTAIGWDGTSWVAYSNTIGVASSEDRVAWKNRSVYLVTTNIGAATFCERFNNYFFIGGSSTAGIMRQV